MANKTINELDDGGAMIAGDTLVAYRDGETKKVGYDGLRTSMINTLYPIGAIYISAKDDIDIETLFPGTTWEKYGEGRTLIGHSSTDSDFGSVSPDGTAGIGGAKEHVLTVGEMPSHYHTLGWGAGYENPSAAHGAGGGGRVTAGSEGTESITALSTESQGLADASASPPVGGHNNLPPYITVYMWRRES
jgi:hypothetical protein